MALYHAYTQTVADGTATSVVRPSDWNSAHQQVLNIGGNTSGTSQISGADIVWAGGNNITLSANGSSVTISAFNQSVQTQASGNIARTGYTSTTQAGSTVGVTLNTAGLSMAYPPFITTYVNDLTSGRAGTGFTSTSTAGANIVATVNTAGVSMGVPAYLTTSSQSVQTQASGNIAGTGFSSTSTAGVLIVGTNNTAGLSLGVPNYITTYVNDLTSGRAGTGFTSTSTAGANIVATVNTAGVSMGVPAYLTTSSQSVQTQASGNIAGTGFSSTSTAGVLIVGTNNTAGLSLGVPNFITTYVNDLTSGRAGTGFTSTSTAGVNIVATVNTAGVSMGVPAYITTYVNDLTSGRAGTGFTSTSTAGANIVATVNTAGVSMGVPVYLTTAAATNITSGRAGTGTTFAGTNITATMGLDTNGLALSLSGAGGGVINQTGPNIAVVGSTVTSGTVVFSNSNGVSFGINGQTLTASVNAGGGATVPYWEPYDLGNNTSIFQLGQNTIYLQPLIPPVNVIVSNVEVQVSVATATSAAASAQVNRTFDYGLYSYGTGASSGSLTLIASSQMIVQIYANSNVSAGYTISQGAGSYTTSSAGTLVNSVLSGQKYMYLPFSTTLTAGGDYQFALRMSSASTLNTSPSGSYGFVILTNQTATTWGKIQTSGAVVSAASYLEEFDGRVYTATSSNLPSVFAESNCSVMNSKARIYYKFEDE